MARVFLDPDGTDQSGWIMVIIEAPTGVQYVNQCCGLATTELSREGYLVPVSGAKMDISDGPVDPKELTRIFHQDGACGSGLPLAESSRRALEIAVAKIPFWTETEDGETFRDALRFDRERAEDAFEAWVPVVTRVGKGILIWKNCD